MKHVINHIRRQPHHKRNQIVWICAAIAAGLMLIIWLAVGNPNRGQTDQNFFQSFNQGLKEGNNLPNPLEE
jgi:hypothetical protein